VTTSETGQTHPFVPAPGPTPIDRSAAVSQAALACALNEGAPPEGALVYLLAAALDSVADSTFTSEVRRAVIQRWRRLPAAEREWWQLESPPTWLLR
jgi:hypothetical protein